MTVAELFYTFRLFRPWFLLWLAIGLPLALILGAAADDPGVVGSARFWLCDAPFTMLIFSVAGSFVRDDRDDARSRQTAAA